jgi:hypothetical protein
MRAQERSRQAWARWRKLVQEQGRSGQSVAAFCRQRRLCAPQFFWWKKRLHEAAQQQAAGRTPGRRGAPRPEFVEVQVTPSRWGRAGGGRRESGAVPPPGCPQAAPPGDNRVEVLLRQGRSLRVGPGFDAELVRALIAVVEGAA